MTENAETAPVPTELGSAATATATESEPTSVRARLVGGPVRQLTPSARWRPPPPTRARRRCQTSGAGQTERRQRLSTRRPRRQTLRHMIYIILFLTLVRRNHFLHIVTGREGQWRHFKIINFSLGTISKLQIFKSLGKCIAAINFTFKDDSIDMYGGMGRIDNVG